jgi:hypothetical protein
MVEWGWASERSCLVKYGAEYTTKDSLESLSGVLSQSSEDLLDITVHVIVQLGQACQRSVEHTYI